jgi:predicted secreted hydrolase
MTNRQKVYFVKSILYHLKPFCLALCFVFCLPLNSKTLISPTKAPQQFQVAKPGYWYRFPQDHAAHPQFATEWWYYTGNLHSARKRDFGYQLTFFRVGLKPGGEPIYAAHFSITDLQNKKFYFWDKLQRPILGMAGTDKTYIWNKNWSVKIEGIEHQLLASQDDIKINLSLYQQGKPVIQGKPKEGISRKGDCQTCASHYYSLPNMLTSGSLLIDGEVYKVSGKSWMDHEFGSNQLQADQKGWDWFSLQFNDGSSLMLYRIRGKSKAFSNGTYVSKNGEQQYLEAGEFILKPTKYWHSKKTKAIYPVVWEVTVPKLDLGIKVYPKLAQQELQTQKSTQVSYWEGAVKAIDRATGKQTAEGYLELTGYAGSLRGKF